MTQRGGVEKAEAPQIGAGLSQRWFTGLLTQGIQQERRRQRWRRRGISPDRMGIVIREKCHRPPLDKISQTRQLNSCAQSSVAQKGAEP